MSIQKSFFRLALASCLGVVLTGLASGGDNVAEVALKVNQTLRSEVPYANAAKAAPSRIDDERFLRRVSLDIIGRLPTPEEVTAFAFDPAADKRAKIVTKLLANPLYGENWGRYWRDVILYRKTEERADGLVGRPLEEYLAAGFNANHPWSQVATEFITATGDATQNGACALIVAQQGQPEETVAEISRIFLGVQIQCAQCHDHPTDRWKREQFHELAAFFPRVAARRILTPDRRDISVTVNDGPERAFGRRPMMMRFQGTAEHRMPDPKNPQSEGKLMQPVFFATGDKLPVGTKDADRRGSLAKWTTEKENPYFAKAFVNRLWSELTGEGFYEPVDDIGPDRHATAPQTLDYLASEFANTGYDIKWLLRVITATELYQLPSAPRRGPEDPPMQHNVSQRLRADQLFENLLLVLEASEPAGPLRVGGGFPARFGGPRQQFATAFGYDPSERREDVAHSIPQALSMMNSPIIAGALRGNGNTMLARKLTAIKDNPALVQELYLKVLGREATSSELTTCLAYVKQVGSRTEAFEDVLWSLVNSAEFLHRS
jgi:uncharacterized protein DUF1549/uncharacterized protein DUF1553